MLQCVAVCSMMQVKFLLSIGLWVWPIHVAVCCRVLQCIAVYCSVVQCGAVRCIVVQRVAVCCSVLQCVAVHCTCCRVWQCVAVWCSVLHRFAVCCSVLQYAGPILALDWSAGVAYSRCVCCSVL